MIHIFGTIACLVYILDRVRLHYPEILARASWVNHAFFRAEEQVRESAMIPYVIASLLTLLTFPKPIALIAITTLALADPASAIVGITWGRRRLLPNKSLEGSSAFLLVTCAVAATVLYLGSSASGGEIARAASLIGLAAATFELVPLRIDDNLTIPLFVGFVSWVICGGLGIQW